MNDDPGLSSSTVCALTGLTYRQLDYLARNGIVEPNVATASGSGSARRWGVDQVKVLRVVERLLEHGARGPALRSAAGEIESLAEDAWGNRIMVTRDGRVVPPLGPDPHGWIVDLGACLDAA